MRRTLLVTVLAASLTMPAAATAADAETAARFPYGPRAPVTTAVERWSAIGLEAFSATRQNPAEGHPIFAFTAVAVYDTVVALRGRFEPFAVRVLAPRGASLNAAVAATAHRVLVHHLPEQQAMLDAAYATDLTRTSGRAERDGVALGRRVAAAHLALRADDGFGAAPVSGPPLPPGPGVWVPTAPTPPLGVSLARVRPLVLESPDQLRPPPPPDLSSPAWARDFNEVKALGSSRRRTSTDATVRAQNLAARFWGEAPVQQARKTFHRFLRDKRLDELRAARYLAMVSVTYADALIACFDAKYANRFWRPLTAIPAGDTDGNPATVADPTWAPLLEMTPNHPEYPSNHSCLTPSLGAISQHVLGTRQIDLTVVSVAGLGDRHFATADALRTEVENARIWGGIHYRSGVDAGTQISRRTTEIVIRDHFLPARR